MFWGLGLALLATTWLVIMNRQRACLEEVRELIPNCLLTRYPLVFVPGRRSLFYFMAYWNQIPHWLASHGYEVFHVNLPWKNKRQRQRALQNFLKAKSDEGEKFHLFFDETTFNEFEDIAERQRYDCLASVTLIGQRKDSRISLSPRLQTAVEDLLLPESGSPPPLYWKLHQLWTCQTSSIHQLGWNLDPEQGLALLDRARFLAERDLIQSQRSPSL